MQAGQADRLWRTARLTILACAVAAAAFLTFRHVHTEATLGAYRPDYTVFWTGARVAASEPQDLYDETALRRAQFPLTGGDRGPRPWVSPPSFLIWLAPFAALPFWPSFLAWIGVGLAGFLAATWRLTRSGWATLLSPVLPAVAVSLLSGQSSLVTGGLTLAAVTWLERRPVLAGGLLGLAATIKPQVMVMAPVALVAGRHGRALAAAVAAGAAVGAVSLTLGPRLWLDWIHALPGFLDLVDAMNLQAQAITPRGLADQIGLPPPLGLALTGAGALTGLVLVWRTFRRRDDPVLRLAALAVGAILATPYAMPYESAVLAPACLMILMRAERAPLLWIGAAATLYLPGGFGPLFLGAALLGHDLAGRTPDLGAGQT